MILAGDCVELMATLEAESVDAIVTDPPYGLEFMGKEWDRLGAETVDAVAQGGFQDGNGGNAFSRSRVRFGGGAATMQDWHRRWATEAFRVAKPGAHLLAFGGTRTYHRLASAIEDAGWEIRDCLVWAYASGFPKSLDVSKAIDKAAGAERNRQEPRRLVRQSQSLNPSGFNEDGWAPQVNDPITPDAQRWNGWGTALKPAWEPIVMARKPLVGTVAANVLAHGTGALNIDATRIPSNGERAGWNDSTGSGPRYTGTTYNNGKPGDFDNEPVEPNALGRWPANVVLTDPILGDDFSRFFTVAKAARSDREPVLRGQLPAGGTGLYDDDGYRAEGERKSGHTARGARENLHPTVKPVELMRHLVRLVTPPGGTVLDCFLGSGTTAIACELEGFAWIGMEREPEYVAIAEARLNGTQRGFSW